MQQDQSKRRRGNLRLGWLMGAVVVLWYLLAMLWILQK
jgi:hypothetical protein